jgi:hypothetical protein
MEISVKEADEQYSTLQDRNRSVVKRLNTLKENLINKNIDLQRLTSAMSNMEKDRDAAINEYKKKHMDFKDHIARIKILNNGLKDCNMKNKTKADVIDSMQAAFVDQKSKMQVMENHLHRMSDENTSLASSVEQHSSDRHVAEASLASTRSEMKEVLAKCEQRHDIAGTALDKCSKRNEDLVNIIKSEKLHISEMEKQIASLLKKVNNGQNLKDFADQAVDEKKISDHKIKELLDSMKNLKEENKNLLHFQEQNKSVHLQVSNLREALEKMHVQYENMNRQYEESQKAIDHYKKSIKSYKGEIDMCSNSNEKIKKKIDHILKHKDTMMPKERITMEKKIMDLETQKEHLSRVIMEKHSDMQNAAETIGNLKKVRHDLSSTLKRYQIDMQNTGDVAESSISLQSELIQAEKRINLRDKQLMLMSKSAQSLIHKVKLLEQRDKELVSQLKFTSGPEETKQVTDRLGRCRIEMKGSIGKINSMKDIIGQMEHRNRIQSAKISSLTEVIAQNSEISQSVKREQNIRVDLQKQLANMKERQSVDPRKFQKNVQEMERIKKVRDIQHLQMMEEAKIKIQKLEKQVRDMGESNNDISVATAIKDTDIASRSMKHMRSSIMPPSNIREPETPQEIKQVIPGSFPMSAIDEPTLQKMENDTERNIKLLQKEMSQVKAHAAKDPSKHWEALMMTMKSDLMKEIHQMSEIHRAAMREKEAHLTNTRKSMYGQILGALKSEPDNAMATIQDITQRGKSRDSASKLDVIRVAAMKAKLDAERSAVRRFQHGMIQSTKSSNDNTFFNNVPNATTEETSDLLRTYGNNYSNLMKAKVNVAQQSQNEYMKRISDQSQYQRDLHPMVGSINQVYQSMKNVPLYASMSRNVDNEKKMVFKAINHGATTQKLLQNKNNAVGMEVNAAIASSRSMDEKVSNALRNGLTNGALQDIKNESDNGEDKSMQIMKANQRADVGNKVQSVVYFRPKTRSEGTAIPPADRLSLGEYTGEVNINSPNKDGPKQYVVDHTEVLRTPDQAMQPTAQKAQKVFAVGGDIIAVSYGFEDIGRKLLINSAIRQLFDTLTGQGPGPVLARMVQTSPGDKRVDLLSNDRKSLPPRCSFMSCNATEIALNRYDNAQDLFADVMKKSKLVESNIPKHTILSLYQHPQGPKIHIVDVLYSNIPQQEIKLLDGSWVSYLSDVMKNTNTRVDLYYNLLPHPTNESIQKNEGLMQVSQRVSAFMTEFKRIHG